MRAIAFSFLLVTGAYAGESCRSLVEPHIAAFAKKLSFACATGKAVEINDGYWVSCHRGVAL